MNIEWDRYPSPNMENSREITLILEHLIDEKDDEDEFLVILYNDLLPNIKHQNRIYTIVIPIIDWFEDLINKNENFPRKIDILDFFGHVFSEHIRESIQILASPSVHDYASKNLKDYDPAEYDFFLHFKKFYLSLFSHILPEKETRSIILYDLCFLDNFLKKYSSKNLKGNNPIVWYDISIAAGIYKFLYPQHNASQIDLKFDESIKNVDLILAINGLEFNEIKLKDIIKENRSIDSIWGYGFLTVIGADSLTIASQNKNEKRLCETIDFLCETYESISKNEPDSEYDFPCHKFLMEDVSTILFRKNFGCQKKLQLTDLNYSQKYFFEKLSEKIKIHTNSMLYAGLLPRGASEKDLLNIDDIFEFYKVNH